MHENRLSARQTSAEFNIPSFQTVLSWERIYLKEGSSGLFKEHRGKCTAMDNPAKGQGRKKTSKDTIGETKEELKAEIEKLRMENECLKKLNALVRERISLQRRKK